MTPMQLPILDRIRHAIAERENDSEIDIDWLVRDELLELHRLVKAMKVGPLDAEQEAAVERLQWRARRREALALDVGGPFGRLTCVGLGAGLPPFTKCRCLATAFDETPSADRKTILARAEVLHGRVERKARRESERLQEGSVRSPRPSLRPTRAAPRSPSVEPAPHAPSPEPVKQETRPATPQAEPVQTKGPRFSPSSPRRAKRWWGDDGFPLF